MTMRLRIGTRRSPLALAQTQIVLKNLKEKSPQTHFDIVEIETTGDKNQISPLSEIGGKGVFIRELENALIQNRIDIAIHSLKDVTANTHGDLILSGFLKAESVKDTIISRTNYTLDTLPQGAKVGTGSMRRKALLKELRPDIVTEDIRGNIGTRISKLDIGFHAILLSEVSIIRLNIQNIHSHPLNPTQFIPAPGQGVVALETRKNDSNSIRLCELITHSLQSQIANAQLAFLQTIGFDCQTPLGMHCIIENDQFIAHLFRSNFEMSKSETKTFSCHVEHRMEHCIEIGNLWKSTPL